MREHLQMHRGVKPVAPALGAPAQKRDSLRRIFGGEKGAELRVLTEAFLLQEEGRAGATQQSRPGKRLLPSFPSFASVGFRNFVLHASVTALPNKARFCCGFAGWLVG